MSEVSINFKIEGVENATTSIDNLSDATSGLDKNVKGSNKSIQTYSQQIRSLQKELVSLGSRTTENAAEFDRLSTSIIQLREEQENLTIGTTKLESQLAVLPGPIGGVAKSFNNFDNTIKNTRGAFINLTKQFPILKNAFVATGIGAIVVIFGLLAAAVIKSFNSFKPLQEAVGNLGTAFEVVGDVVKPLIELIGKGLTVAVNGVARAIAFLTGNLEEYEKKVRAAEATKALEANLEYEKELYELSKDQFIESERQRTEAALQFRTRINEINEKYKNDELRRNQLLLAAQQTYYAQITKAEKTAQEEKKKSNQLTDEQIAKLKQAQAAAKSAFENELLLYAARQIGGIDSVKILKQLEESYNLINKTLDENKSKQDLFNESLGLFNLRIDEGYNYLTQWIKRVDRVGELLSKPNIDPEQKQLKATQEFIMKVYSDIEQRRRLFSKETLQDMELYKRNIDSMVGLLSRTDISVSDFSAKLIDLQRARNENLLDQEKKAQDAYIKLKQDFIKKDAAALLEQNRNQLKAKETTNVLTQEMAEDFAKSNLEALERVASQNAKFVLQVDLVKQKVEEINVDIQRAINKGVIVDFINQNIEGFTQLVNQIKEVSGELSKADFEKTFSDLSKVFPSLARVSTEQINIIYDKYKENHDKITKEIEMIDVNQFSSQYDLQLERLKLQKEIDKERLRQAGATAQQLLAIDDAYSKKVQALNFETLMMNADMVAQTLGMITGQLDETTDLFKSLKYAEALVTAISSSMRAYEFGLAFGGPAGVVLAPILAGTTFATQMAAANRILQVPEPKVSSTGSTSRPNPTYTGYYEEGGLVYGPRHSRGGVQAELEGGEYIINRRAMMNPIVADMAMTLNNMNNVLSNPQQFYQPPVVKTYVLSGEMTTQQRADRRIRNLARL